MAGDPFIGEIRLFGFSFAPRGWLMAQGQMVAIAQNQALYALYSTLYGGNGTTNFGIPDLRGRVAVGQGPMPGGQNWQMGMVAGTPTTTLSSINLPAHVHTFTGTMSASDTKASDNTPAAGGFLGRANDNSGNNPPSTPVIYVPAGTSATIPLGGVSGTTQPTGSGQPFSIQPPSLGLNYSVATMGIYPTRN